MSNPIVERINNKGATITPTQNQNDVFIQNLRQTAQQIKAMKNPQSMLQNMILQNPRLNEAIAFIKQFGGDPEQALISMAKQKGLDPQQILNAIKSI